MLKIQVSIRKEQRIQFENQPAMKKIHNSKTMNQHCSLVLWDQSCKDCIMCPWCFENSLLSTKYTRLVPLTIDDLSLVHDYLHTIIQQYYQSIADAYKTCYMQQKGICSEFQFKVSELWTI